MIKTYGDETTLDVHYDRDTKKVRRIPKDLWPVARRKLNRLNSATSLSDLAIPGDNLKRLKGDRPDEYSMRVNDQWRVVFRFEKGNAFDVTIEDYHYATDPFLSRADRDPAAHSAR